jgi:AraC-like DNA-binding protein
VLNEGQAYAIDIESREPIESFCVFFAPGFVEEVRRALSSEPVHLLDQPESTDPVPVRFFEKNYPHDDVLSPALRRLRAGCGRRDAGWMEEQLHDMVERLLRVHRLAWRETARLKGARPSTREELYRRVCRGRDYADAMFAEPVTLADMARAACLSPNHFLRTFRRAFGQTPHQFLRERRLREAKLLLARGDRSVTDVCLAVGFESLGSFSTLFHSRFGMAPSEVAG